MGGPLKHEATGAVCHGMARGDGGKNVFGNNKGHGARGGGDPCGAAFPRRCEVIEALGNARSNVGNRVTSGR